MSREAALVIIGSILSKQEYERDYNVAISRLTSGEWSASWPDKDGTWHGIAGRNIADVVGRLGNIIELHMSHGPVPLAEIGKAELDKGGEDDSLRGPGEEIPMHGGRLGNSGPGAH